MGARGYLTRRREGRKTGSDGRRFLFDKTPWPVRLEPFPEGALGWVDFRADLVPGLLKLLSVSDARALTSCNRKLAAIGESFFTQVARERWPCEWNALVTWLKLKGLVCCNPGKLVFGALEAVSDVWSNADELQLYKMSARYFAELTMLTDAGLLNPFRPAAELAGDEDEFASAVFEPGFEVDVHRLREGAEGEKEGGGEEEDVNVLFPFAIHDYTGTSLTRAHAIELLKVLREVLKPECVKFLWDETGGDEFCLFMTLDLVLFVESEVNETPGVPARQTLLRYFIG